MDTLIKLLVQANIDPERIIPRAVMARYTTFHIGGPADVLVNIASAHEIPLVLRAAKLADTPDRFRRGYGDHFLRGGAALTGDAPDAVDSFFTRSATLCGGCMPHRTRGRAVPLTAAYEKRQRKKRSGRRHPAGAPLPLLFWEIVLFRRACAAPKEAPYFSSFG